jgi:CRP-like cAMP-binding protein
MELIFWTTIEKMVALSSESRQALQNLLVPEEHPKDSILVQPGTVSPNIYFLSSGLSRNFYYNAEGKEITSWFDFEGSFLASVQSYVWHKPSFEYIQLLEPSLVYRISHEALRTLFWQSHEICNLGRLIAEHLCDQLANRVVALQFKTAKERYEQLVKEQPDLFLRVSLISIASFLGISRETLSRMRGQY